MLSNTEIAQIKQQVEQATAIAIAAWQARKTKLAIWNFENGMRLHMD